jgi:hypothetical protein
MARSQEKSLFLHRQKDAWDRLIEDTWLRGELAEQLIAAHREVAKLAPAG